MSITDLNTDDHLLSCGYSYKEPAVLVVAKEQEKMALAVVHHEVTRAVCDDHIAMIRAVSGLPASVWFLHRFDGCLPSTKN